ncbi:MAG: hypothetical protein AAFV45_13660 [Pseudomonadota bacterium]
MASRSARKIEIRKKKAKHRIARPNQSRVQGNTLGARTMLRKESLKRQGREPVAEAAAE